MRAGLKTWGNALICLAINNVSSKTYSTKNKISPKI